MNRHPWYLIWWLMSVYLAASEWTRTTSNYPQDRLRLGLFVLLPVVVLLVWLSDTLITKILRSREEGPMRQAVTNIETDIEPPEPEEAEDDTPSVYVSYNISTIGGTNYNASAVIPSPDGADEVWIAHTWLAVLESTARLAGPEMIPALKQAIQDRARAKDTE